MENEWNGVGSSPRKEYITRLENWRRGNDEEVPDGGEDTSEARRGTSSALGNNKCCKFSTLLRPRLPFGFVWNYFNKYFFPILATRPQSWRVDDPPSLRDLQSSRPFSNSSSCEDRPVFKGQTGERKKLGFYDNTLLPEW